jgi:hypothetical protein
VFSDSLKVGLQQKKRAGWEVEPRPARFVLIYFGTAMVAVRED